MVPLGHIHPGGTWGGHQGVSPPKTGERNICPGPKQKKGGGGHFAKNDALAPLYTPPGRKGAPVVVFLPLSVYGDDVGVPFMARVGPPRPYVLRRRKQHHLIKKGGREEHHIIVSTADVNSSPRRKAPRGW